jgi:GDP-4-dehydro-6-deoxy-D-mannose reductase
VGGHLLAWVRRETPDGEIDAWHRSTRPPASAAGAGGTHPPHWHAVDVLDRQQIGRALDAAPPPDQVYHLAGAANVAQSWRHTAGTLAVNAVGTHLLLDELRRRHIDARVLVAGSGTIYAAASTPLTEESPVAPASPYALSKLAQEMVARRAFDDDRQQVLIARAFNHFGPAQEPSFFAPGFARQLAAIEQGAAEPVLRVGNLDAERDLTDVRDTVRAYAALMAHGEPGRPYNVCSGRARRIGDILDVMIARCRVPVKVVVDPTLLRPSDVPVVVGSYARLHRDTGWRPVVALEQTIDDILDDARQQMSSSMGRVAQGGTG